MLNQPGKGRTLTMICLPRKSKSKLKEDEFYLRDQTHGLGITYRGGPKGKRKIMSLCESQESKHNYDSR